MALEDNYISIPYQLYHGKDLGSIPPSSDVSFVLLSSGISHRDLHIEPPVTRQSVYPTVGSRQ